MIVIKWFLYFVSELCLLGAFICSLNLWEPKIQRANSVDESFRIPELNKKVRTLFIILWSLSLITGIAYNILEHFMK
jgi:hypothetical protein